MSGERPSRTAGEENFPVASLLIAPRLRPTISRFYNAARTADDIADDPVLGVEEKQERLARFEATLEGLHAPYLRQMLQAFRQDAVQSRYENWSELTAYCAVSANPVGRFLLDLHDEDAAGYPASDALCTALQVLNHLQDCADDYRTLDRVYLPQAWLALEGASEGDLVAAHAPRALRRVLDLCLAEIDLLLEAAAVLPLRLRSTRLALEAAVIIALAEALSRQLQRRDPLAERVQIARPIMAAVALRAAAVCFWRRLWETGRRRRRQTA